VTQQADAIVGAVESIGQVTHCVEARYDRHNGCKATDSIGNKLSHGSATTTQTSYTYPGYGATRPHAPTGYTTTTNGNPVATSQTWKAPGQLASTTTSGTTTSYNWNGTGAVPGQLAAITTGSTTTSYRYDAAGNLLLVKDGGTATLYLPGEELTASSGGVTATRYYTLGSRTIAARTSPTAVSWLFGDPRGTSTTAINATSQAVTSRYYTPYGQPRGTTPANWPGTRGYIGGTTDTTTGLTNLGAREYNPATPAFISPDPILDPNQPASLNPYAYAGNNPVTNSDPTGLCFKTAMNQPCRSSKDDNGDTTTTTTTTGTTTGGTTCDAQCHAQAALWEARQAAIYAEQARAAQIRLGADLTSYFNYLADPGGNIFANLFRTWLCGDSTCMGTTPEGMNLTRRINNDVTRLNTSRALADSSAAAMMTFLGMPRPRIPDELRVFDPNAPGKSRTITDIDTVFRGALTELKSATWAIDNTKFANDLRDQLGRYLEARQHVPGWEDAPLGARFTEPGVQPALRAAVTNAVTQFPQDEEVDVILTFVEDEVP
jgi:RHS repeat-associated protein